MTEATHTAIAPASLVRVDAQHVQVSGAWTARYLGGVQAAVEALATGVDTTLTVDARGLTGLDSAGAWLLQTVLLHARAGQGDDAQAPEGLDARHRALLARVAQRMHLADEPGASAPKDAPAPANNPLQALGKTSFEAGLQLLAVLALLGELTTTACGALLHPQHWRWRQVLFNVRTSGVDALPIVGLLAFLLGIVVAYQSADQLQQFGANIFIVDVVGLSMLREFAPMITAIIVAGRSGSAFAAQIGTMMVTEEIDAMRTLGLDPLELLVLPKLMALVVALPLLTFFADVMGVLGGMLMANWQLDVGFEEFGNRFTKAVSVTAYLVGIGKAPVFAVIIVVIGCFQGLQTRGGPDSVGRQTTRAVVHSTFLVIVADALFSIAFSALDL